MFAQNGVAGRVSRQRINVKSAFQGVAQRAGGPLAVNRRGVRTPIGRDCPLEPATQTLLQDAGLRLSARPRPDRVCPCPKDPERRPADHVTLQIERVADHSVRRQKPLRRIPGLEPEHLSLAPSDRQM